MGTKPCDLSAQKPGRLSRGRGDACAVGSAFLPTGPNPRGLSPPRLGQCRCLPGAKWTRVCVPGTRHGGAWDSALHRCPAWSPRLPSLSPALRARPPARAGSGHPPAMASAWLSVSAPRPVLPGQRPGLPRFLRPRRCVLSGQRAVPWCPLKVTSSRWSAPGRSVLAASSTWFCDTHLLVSLCLSFPRPPQRSHKPGLSTTKVCGVGRVLGPHVSSLGDGGAALPGGARAPSLSSSSAARWRCLGFPGRGTLRPGPACHQRALCPVRLCPVHCPSVRSGRVVSRARPFPRERARRVSVGREGPVCGRALVPERGSLSSPRAFWHVARSARAARPPVCVCVVSWPRVLQSRCGSSFQMRGGHTAPQYC